MLNVLERCERAARPQGSRQGLNAKSTKVVVAQAGSTSHLQDGHSNERGEAGRGGEQITNSVLPERPERCAQRQLCREGTGAIFADLVRAQTGLPDTRERGARTVRPSEKQSFQSDEQYILECREGSARRNSFCEESGAFVADQVCT